MGNFSHEAWNHYHGVPRRTGTTWWSSGPPWVTTFSLIFVYTSGIIGTAVNAIVLVVLIRARRQFGSGVNRLIINQSVLGFFSHMFFFITNSHIINQCVLDMFSCFFSVVAVTVWLAGLIEYEANGIGQFGDQVLCIFIEGGALTAVTLNGGKTGLMVITAERYFKVAHAILHRKYYRNWMTSVGVALPWVSETCTVLIPAMGTTRIVNGFCERMAVWPNAAMKKVCRSI